jgi:HSP20 family protein
MLSSQDFFTASPFEVMRRMSDEMDRMMQSFGLRRGGRGGGAGMEPATWVPPIEIFERDNQIVVRAELPGLKKEDVNVELQEDRIVIQGERRREQEERDRGYYVSESSYGMFYREIPLPDGVDPDRAKARFDNGVLEVSMPVSEQRKRRRIEVDAGETSQARKPNGDVGTRSTQESGARSS